jgi:hypothetical protein
MPVSYHDGKQKSINLWTQVFCKKTKKDIEICSHKVYNECIFYFQAENERQRRKTVAIYSGESQERKER